MDVTTVKSAKLQQVSMWNVGELVDLKVNIIILTCLMEWQICLFLK